MKKMNWKKYLALFLVFAAAAAALWFISPPVAQAPVDEAPLEDASRQDTALSPDAEIIQTMGFSRCGHSVTRRIKAPAALSGADFAGVKGYYDLWQIDSFQRDQVVMNRVLPLFCPLHTVLSCDEAGNVVLCENMYGDGMAVKETTPYSLSDFDEACQEQLLLSLGFDSREDALAWLSSH